MNTFEIKILCKNTNRNKKTFQKLKKQNESFR